MNFDIAGLYKYYLENPTYPYQPEGIETLQPILPLQQIVNTDQGSDSTDINTTTTTTRTTPYTGQPIRFRDVAQLAFNPIYGIPNLISRSQGYTSPWDWAKQTFGPSNDGFSAVTKPGTYGYDDVVIGGSGTGGASESTFSSQGFGSEGNTVSTDFGSFDLSRD
jgi:hypothetical protein